MEANRIGHLAALAVLAGRHEQILSAQLGAVVAQDEDSPMHESEPCDIAVMARLDARRAAAGAGLERTAVYVDFPHPGAELAVDQHGRGVRVTEHERRMRGRRP